MAQINKKNNGYDLYWVCTVWGGANLGTLWVSFHLPDNNSMMQISLLLHFTKEETETLRDLPGHTAVRTAPVLNSSSWTPQPTLSMSYTV